MVDVDDPQNFAGDLETELRRQRESDDVPDETAEAVAEFVGAHEEGLVPDDEELSTGSLVKYSQTLRYCAEAVDSPLREASVAQLGEYLQDVANAKSASFYNAHVAGLYAFSDYHELGWNGEWDWVQQELNTVDPDRLFSDEEVNALLEAADARNQTIVGVLADVGCRVGALCSFRIRDLDLSGRVPQLAFNTNAATKSADGKVLLAWSQGHIETYLSTDHPRPDDPSAPLIHKKAGYAPENDDDDGAVSPSRVRNVLYELGEEVGIPRDRMRTHNFRHTAVSNWIRQGWKVRDIVHRASWAGPEMLQIYDNVTDEKKNEDLAARLGIVEDEDVATDPSEATIECPRCSTPVRRDANFCAKCSLQMSRAPAFEDDGVDPVTLDEDASSEPEPSVPDGVWADGAGDVLEDVPPEVLMQKLVEKSDVDVSDLVDE